MKMRGFISFLIFLSLLGSAAAQRNYFPVEPSALADSAHTHVKVCGRVTLVSREKDGDLHIRLSDDHGFAVAECIPKLPCKRPKIYSNVCVYGIRRDDDEHGWSEVHPVERLEILKEKTK